MSDKPVSDKPGTGNPTAVSDRNRIKETIVHQKKDNEFVVKIKQNREKVMEKGADSFKIKWRDYVTSTWMEKMVKLKGLVT